MEIHLSTKTFLENNLTDEEVFYLLLLANDCNIERARASLIEKGYITQDGNLFGVFRITDEGMETLNSAILDSDNKVPAKDNLIGLVIAIQELFPKGSKFGGTSWRGSQREISVKLQKWFKLYGTYTDKEGKEHKWTYPEIIDATQRYVNHFNGDYKFMRQLKYFILKFEKKMDAEGRQYSEEVSDLASYLENPDANASHSTDWTSSLV